MSRRERVVLELAKRWPTVRRMLPARPLPLPTRAGVLYVSLRNSPTSLQRVFRTYEPRKFDNLTRFLPTGGGFVDVGAHIGDFTVWAAKVGGPDARVLAIEPSPDTVQQLHRAVLRNGISRQVRVEQCAASAEEGTVELLMTPQSGTHSIVEGPLHSMDRFRPQSRVPVRTLPLDDLIDRAGLARVDVVKIDVEGAELLVLAGAKGLLANGKPLVLLIDLHFGVDTDELARILREAGFTLRTENAPDVVIDQLPERLLSVVAVRS